MHVLLLNGKIRAWSMGFKGPSLLYLIPGFDVARGFAPDIMHCLALGVSKKFIKNLDTNIRSPYYIKEFGKVIDVITSSVCPSEDIPSIVRSQKNYGKN